MVAEKMKEKEKKEKLFEKKGKVIFGSVHAPKESVVHPFCHVSYLCLIGTLCIMLECLLGIRSS